MAKVSAGSRERPFDIGILDLQIGSMGGIAVAMAQRLDESTDLVPKIPLLVLLDRFADVHLARRSGAEGWLVKPLDPLRLRRAVRTVIGGGTFHEGWAEVQARRAPAPHRALTRAPGNRRSGRGPGPVESQPLRGVAQLG